MGVVAAFSGNTLPAGWLLCDGSAVSRENYAALFSVIGATYGAGDGTDTFNLPNLVDKFIEGSATAGTVKDAALPNISGEVFILSANNYSTKISTVGDGAFYGTTSPSTPMFNSTQSGGAPSTGTYNKLDISASRSSSVYKNGVTTVQPPALTMKYAIYSGVVTKKLWLRTV